MCKSQVVSSEIEPNSSLEYAGILLQMKMRASASMIFQKKVSSPKMINNINNEVMTNGRFIQGDSYLGKEDITSRLVLPSLTPQLTISPV